MPDLISECETLRVTVTRLEERLAGMQRALDKADAILESYKISNNEWKQTLSDTHRIMVSRVEYDAKHDALAQAVDAIRVRIAAVEGQKQGIGSTTNMFWVAGGVVVAVVVAVIAFLRH